MHLRHVYAKCALVTESPEEDVNTKTVVIFAFHHMYARQLVCMLILHVHNVLMLQYQYKQQGQ